MNGRYHRARLAREAVHRRRAQRTPEEQSAAVERWERFAAEPGSRWPGPCDGAWPDCPCHLAPENLPREVDDDGSVDAICPQCGERWPLVDVGHELWLLTAEDYPGGPRRPRGTARQRRITRQQRRQRARRHAAWRAGRRVRG